MHLPNIKHTPKWALYASGAVIAGAVGYRVYKSRGGGASVDYSAQDASTTSTDTSLPSGGDLTGSSNVGGGVTVVQPSAPATVTPDAPDTSWMSNLIDGSLGLAGKALDAANNTTDSIVGWSETETTHNDANYGTYAANMAGGSAGVPAVSTSPQVVTAVPAAVAPVAAPTSNHDGFPHQNKATLQWYKDVTATAAGKDSNGHAYAKGHVLHVYQNGQTISDN